MDDCSVDGTDEGSHGSTSTRGWSTGIVHSKVAGILRLTAVFFGRTGTAGRQVARAMIEQMKAQSTMSWRVATVATAVGLCGLGGDEAKCGDVTT